MGVNILNRNAPASKGAVIDTGTAFVTGVIGSGSQTTPVLCQSIPDFEAGFSTRTGAAIPVWDWLDVFFREGGNQAYVLDYATAGGETAALALFSPYLGPGQVAVIGEAASATVYGAIQAHCDSNNRVGLLDVKSTDITAAELAVEGALGQALTSKNNVGCFGTWLNVPAPAGVIGASARTVPASAAIAGMCNLVDQEGNPNQPPGGRDFPLQFATSPLFDPILTSDQTTIANAGVNYFHDAWGVLENYSFITPVYTGSPPPTTTPFWQLNCSRARMFLQAHAAIIGESYYMKDIDGQGKLAGRLAAELGQLCKQLYDAGGLYGDTAADAYSINVGASVNNNGTAATATLNAVAEVVFSEYAQTVNITLVSVPVGGSF